MRGGIERQAGKGGGNKRGEMEKEGRGRQGRVQRSKELNRVLKKGERFDGEGKREERTG